MTPLSTSAFPFNLVTFHYALRFPDAGARGEDTGWPGLLSTSLYFPGSPLCVHCEPLHGQVCIIAETGGGISTYLSDYKALNIAWWFSTSYN